MSMRVVVVGDDGVGKSSLITALVKDTFVPNIEDVLPPLVVRQNPRVYVHDTSPQLSNNDQLSREIRQASVIWLVYSDHYTYERIRLFWLPYLRSIGVNLPIILTQNKLDLHPDVNDDEDIVALMHDFKEIESFIRCSAKDKVNVNEAFYFCQRAVTDPLAPLFDSKEGELKPDARRALSRVFFLCDHDQTGYLSDIEFLELQFNSFRLTLDPAQLEEIHALLRERQVRANEVYTVPGKGISLAGFLCLNQVYAERGRHETIWGILRFFHYTNSLSLDDRFLHPTFDIPALSRVELSPEGYRYFVDLFTLFDKDDDGGLSDAELDHLFTPTPGLPKLWLETGFPSSAVRNEEGYVTLQGWIAQWSMTALLDPQSTLEYLAMLGYESKYGHDKITTALRITKQARPRNPRSRIYRNSKIKDRNVFNAYVLGAPSSGKSVLLSSFLQRPYTEVYNPTITVQTVVNSLEMPGGKQCYLVLQELGELEPAILENAKRLDQCDVVCCVYDSSDPESFSHLVKLLEKNPQLKQLPLVFAALKADLDRQQQRSDEQPDEFTSRLGINQPLHVSAQWPASLSALFQQLVDSAENPGPATPIEPDMLEEASLWETAMIVGTGITAVVVAYALVRRALQ